MGPWPCETLSFVFPLFVKFSKKQTDCFPRKRCIFLSWTVKLMAMLLFLVFIGCGYAAYGSEKEGGLQEKAYEGMHELFF